MALTPVILPNLTPVAPGNNAVGVLTFNEGVPPDGAVQSSDPTVATISLDPDGITWRAVGLKDGNCTFTYTGTSTGVAGQPPVIGPVAVAPMSCTVADAPQAETGSFNPSTAVIT